MTTKNWAAKRKARFLSRCIHDIGAYAPNCAAGVDPNTILDKTKQPYRRICTNPEATIPCDKRELPTEADYEAHLQKVLADLNRMAKIREAIIATGQQQGRIDCPCCDGKVRFSIASNGHVAAACSTDGCARWME